MWFILLLALVVAGFFAYKHRVQLLARILGQPEHRVRRALEERRRNR